MLRQYFGLSDEMTSLEHTQFCYCTANMVTDVESMAVFQ